MPLVASISLCSPGPALINFFAIDFADSGKIRSF